MRAALEELPTWHCLSPGQDAYVVPSTLARQLPRARRWWTFNGRLSTLERPDGTLIKSLAPFVEHQTLPQFNDLITESAAVAGVHRPTGYSDVFHKLYTSPYTTPSYNAVLRQRFAGGWQEAIATGYHPGEWRRYDLRSAYLWAATLGLPDPKSYRPVSAIQSHPALYRVELQHPVAGAPFPFSTAVDVLATEWEIDLYGLPVRRVLAGLSWRREVNVRPLVDAVQAVTYWKLPARMFWGRWAQVGSVDCHTHEKEWKMRNPRANIVWAHLIVARVRSKLWQATDATTCHVYVDSLITRGRLRTGTGLGDWRLEETYTGGIVVKGPGHYGHPHRPAQKWAGAAHSDPRRADPLTI